MQCCRTTRSASLPDVAHPFKLPDLGEGLTEGEVARWLVAEGQQVAEDEPLVEIQTDKTTVEIPSPAAGKVARILVEAGQLVPVGTPLVLIGADADAPAPEQRKAQATPLVRKVAAELGVAAADVLAIGDGRNDIEMLRWAGRGVAMGQSPLEVQEAADDVTETVANDGVARELSRWFPR